MLVTLFRTAVLYIVVVLCMRAMGKRQVGELQPSELVVTILISELASIPMQDLNRPVTNGIIAIFTLVILELLLSALTLKFQSMRRLFSGKAAIVIQNGEIDQKMMRSLRITVDDLLEGIRQSGCFDIEDVDFAIMETSGKISVLPKDSCSALNKGDVGVKGQDDGMPMTVIIDGKLQKECIKSEGIPEDKIDGELQRHGLTLQRVFLMTVNSHGEFYIIRKD